MSKKILFVLAAFLMIASIIVSGCAKTALPQTEEKASEKQADFTTIKPGVLTVGSDCTWRPMEYIEGDTIVGFDVDLTKALAQKMGLKLDFQNAAWDGLFPAVITHKYDMVISSITITDDRKKQMDFSDPYYNTDQAAVVIKGSGLDSLEKFEGKVAAVQIGTTGELVARDIKDVTVKTYDDIILAFEELKAGRVDGVVCDSYLGAYEAKLTDNFEVGFVVSTDEHLGIGFAKDTPELVKAVNKALQEIKDDGTYDEIMSKWFGEK